MNHIFRPFLRKFVLVFFDDILVYSKSIEAHISHLQHVFEQMRAHTLVAKLFKCCFGTSKVEYLGHFVSATSISIDPRKIQAIQDWPIPTSVKDLRSFFGSCRILFIGSLLKIMQLLLSLLLNFCIKETLSGLKKPLKL